MKQISQNLCIFLFAISFGLFPFCLYASDGNGGGSCVEGSTVDCKGDCGGQATFDTAGNCCLETEQGCDSICFSGLVVDECGECGGPGASTCGCGQTLNQYNCCGSETDEGCGCGEPLNSYGCCGNQIDEGCGCGVTCPPQECFYVASWANWSGIWSYGSGPSGYNLTDVVPLYDYTNREAVPGCFAQRFANACVDEYHGGTVEIYGGCNSTGSYGGNVTVYDLGTFLGVPSSEIPNLTTQNWGHAEYMMDSSCNYVPWNPSNELCGFAGVSWSPISLVWDSSSPIENGMTVVSFSLAVSNPDGYSLWKASEKAPLLVFDPYKTGEVSSARQLFGNHAFGGVTTRVADFQSKDLRSAWTNGFEALALLDRNSDKKISGEELEGISLWFDRDRDAEVDEGELRTVKSEGIVSLYFDNVKEVSDSKDLMVNIGYERMVDGRLVKGAAVDWYSEVFTSRQEAMNALAAIFRASDERKIDRSVPLLERTAHPDWPKKPLEFAPRQVSNHENDISGFWYWTLKEKGAEKHPGVFAFEETAGKDVVGYSVIESMLEKNDKFRSATTIVPAKGEMQVNKNGERIFSFEVYDPRSQSKAVSTARLSKNGEVMFGTTTQTFETKKDGKDVSATLDYEWVARKVTNKG